MIHTQSGITSLNLVLILLPLVMFAMLIFTSYQLIDYYSKTQKLCRSQVLLAQKTIGLSLQKLIGLNNNASSLRAEERRLKAALVPVAGTPAAVPIIKLIKVNHFRQSVLRGRQELLIRTAKFRARNLIQKLRGQLGAKVTVRTTPIVFEVQKKPPHAVAPSFYPVAHFEQRQLISVRWTLKLQHVIANPLLSYLNGSKTIKGRCAATLVAKGDSWDPKLRMARF